MTREEAQKLWAQVKENALALERCKAHKFEGFAENWWRMPNMRLRCVNCGGEMCANDALHYVRGYQAAGGNGDDVIKGWSKR